MLKPDPIPDSPTQYPFAETLAEPPAQIHLVTVELNEVAPAPQRVPISWLSSKGVPPSPLND